MKKPFAVLFTFVFCAISAASAFGALIDFEDLTVPPGFNTNADVTSRGFLYDSALDHSHLYISGDTNVFTANGTNYYASDDFVGENPVTMRRTDSATFDLATIDFAEFLQSNRVSLTITVTGHKFGGGTPVRVITLDQIRDGAGGVNDFQTEAFNADWTNLTSVEFKGAGSQTGEDYFALDNINTTRVPEPISTMLFTLGLLSLAVACRRPR
jgi:hypothetical protein